MPQRSAVGVSASLRFIMFVGVLHFALLMNLRAQSRDIAFEHFSVDQGLSSPVVSCVYQDSTGYLWFGTNDGLDRYDGYGFTSYRHQLGDSTSLINAIVQTLHEDKNGNLWVITSRGLDKLDRITGRFTHYTPAPPRSGLEWRSHIFSICEDDSGLFWIGTGDGLAVFNPATGVFVQLRHDSTNSGSVKSNITNATYRDRSGTIWIGTDEGLDKLDRRTRQFFHYWCADSVESDWRNSIHHVTAIFEDHSGVLWFGTNGGLIAFDRRTGIFTPYSHDPKDEQSLSDNHVSSICEDKSGVLWVGTWLGGLNAFDTKSKKFLHYMHDENDSRSLSSNNTWTVCFDRSGTLWIGTGLEGVNKLNWTKTRFIHYKHAEGKRGTLSADKVFRLSEDNAGMLWLVTKWLEIFDPRTQMFIPKLQDETIKQIVHDRKGMLLLGTPHGIYEYNGRKRLFHIHDENGREFRPDVNAFCETRDDKLLIGTYEDGLFLIDRRTNTAKRVKTTISTLINKIFEDASGLIWVGMREGGLLCFDPIKNTEVRYAFDSKNPSSLSGNTVMTIYEDKAGSLWLGTDIGLNKLDRATSTFTHFTEKDGLPSNVVYAIAEDNHGNLWVSTSRGISKFNPKTSVFKNYDVSDGLAGNLFYARAGLRARNGEMYFGGPNGLTRFHPDSIKDNLYLPPIVITKFNIFDKPAQLDTAISLKKTLELSYKENIISFEFSALSYLSPERNLYAYKLEGFDTGWVYCGTRRHATYTNLDGGKYTFRAKGSNNDGVWNETGTSIAVIITPPFWKTWWFTTFLWVTLAGSAGGAVRYVEIRKMRQRMRVLEQQQALDHERLRISRDMHDEVGATLTEIAILSELAQTDMQKTTEARAHIQKIAEHSRQVIDNIGEIIWAINPTNDHLVNLASYLRTYAVQYLSHSSIRCRANFPESVPDLHLSAESRRNIFLVVKEALHNVVKHSEATDVNMTLTADDQVIAIAIEDNGKGFHLNEDTREGIGLHSMKKRAEDIGGTIAFESNQPSGTRVHLRIPMASAEDGRRSKT